MSNKVMVAIILLIILIIWNFILVEKKSERYRALKELKYFKILEEGFKTTDYNERKKLNNELKGVYVGLFFLGLIAISYFGERWGNNVWFYIISISLLIGITILFYCQYSFIGIYLSFYVLPILTYILLKGTREGKVTKEYLLVIFLLYFLMAIVYPVIYLRKIDSHVVLWSAIIVAMVTMIKNIVYPDFDYSFVGGGYAIGLFFIKFKILHYKNIAKDEYSKLIMNNRLSAEKKYDICKKCVFYGGEEYKNRILDNVRLRNIIMQKE